ncbi:unnamed protein product [Orchesella dallaii]|uniref:O-acyltransferase WSD1 C-terminal domain-containing protein n=1 Tax=Orchesella dallaii TaxID=48710 RepID=A0ABP1QER3_9HEXA
MRVVVVLSKFLRKDLLRPVTGLDISFCTDDFFGRPHGGLSFIWLIDGPLRPNLLIDRLEKVMASRTSKNYDYEKLTTVVPTFWLGYPFWKKTDKEFRVQNHVKIMDVGDEYVQPNDINKRICEWMVEPFGEGLPLWEIRVVPQVTSLKLSLDAHQTSTRFHEKDLKEKKCDDMQSILILKTHHIIGDGYSMLGLLDKIVDSPNNRPYIPVPLQQIKRRAKTEETMLQQKQVKKGQQEGFPFERESLGNSNFTLHLKSWIERSFQSGIEVSKGFLCQLSSAIFLAFFTPSTLFSLLNEFGFHRDCWFTNKKVSSQLNLATVSIPLKRLNDLRRDLCKTFHVSRNNEQSSLKTRRNPVPTIVIAVSSLAGALRRFFQRREKMLAPPELDIIDDHLVTNVRETPDYVNFVAALPLKKRKHPGSHIFCNFW